MRAHKPSNLKAKGTLEFLLFQTITLGIYPIVWFWRQRKTLNELAIEEEKPLQSAHFVVMVIGMLLWYGMFLFPVFVEQLSFLSKVIIYLSYILTYYWTIFSIRRILRVYFSEDKKFYVNINGFWTFIFGFVYLQYKINWLLRQEAIEDRTEVYTNLTTLPTKTDYSMHYQPHKLHRRIGWLIFATPWIISAGIVLMTFIIAAVSSVGYTIVLGAASISVTVTVILNIMLLGVIIPLLCRKELRPGSSYDERSGRGEGSVAPLEVDRWNWGASFFGYVWGSSHRVWILFLSFVPYVATIMTFFGGLYGNRWAWQKNKWYNIDHFLQVQRKWNIAAAIYLGICSVFMLLYLLILLPLIISDARDGSTFDTSYQTHDQAQVESLQEALLKETHDLEDPSVIIEPLFDNSGDEIEELAFFELYNQSGALIDEGITSYRSIFSNIEIENIYSRRIILEKIEAGTSSRTFDDIDDQFWNARILDETRHPVGGAHYFAKEDLNRGANLVNTGFAKESITALEETLDYVDEDDVELYAKILINIAVGYGNMSNNNKMMATTKQAAELIDPTYVKYHRYQGLYQDALGNISEAEAHFERTLELSPRDFFAHSKLARYYADVDNIELYSCENALVHNEFLATNFIGPNIRTNLASTYICLEKFESAIAQLNMVDDGSLSEDRKKFLYAQYAEAYYGLGSYADAYDSLTRAVAIDSSFTRRDIAIDLCAVGAEYCVR